MKIAILGAGNGGVSAAVELGKKGFVTQLWNRSGATLAPLREAGGIGYTGVFGEGLAQPALITTELAQATAGADLILICLPATAHAGLARELAELQQNRTPVILNPGHTGGALEFSAVFRSCGAAPPPTAELSTLTYVARKREPALVHISGAARQVRVAALPDGAEAMDGARALYPAAEPAADVIATGLANVNLVLHPPGAILGASWVEATGGDFRFYVEGLSEGTGRIMEALDAERLAVATAFGYDLPDLFTEMQSIGTIEKEADAAGGLAAAVRGGKANRHIRAPDSLDHRYYREDFWYGIQPFLVLADIAGAPTPVAASLMKLAELLVRDSTANTGRSAQAMGIAGMDQAALRGHVRGSS